MSAGIGTVGVVGAGTMGRGIAQLCAQAGHDVLLHDADAGALSEARAFAGRMLARAAEKGRMTAEDAEAAAARIRPAAGLAELAPCDLVIEAIVEAEEPKRALFAELAGLLAPGAILATNTSSLSVSRLAAAVPGPERVAGLHFFNPVPVMRLVEVIAGVRTDPAVADRLAAFVEGLGHAPVRAADSPGFLVNHIGRGLYTEGLRVVQEGVAPPPAVDDVMREAAGFRMGPFELFDLTGLDVSFPVTRSIYEQFWHEPRFRPTPLPPVRVAAGLLGRKSGEGFYAYDAEGRIVRPEPAPPPEGPDLPIHVVPGPEAEAVRAALAGAGVALAEAPGPETVALLAPLGEDATTAALAAGVDPERAVAVDPLFGLEGRRTLMTTPVTRPETRDAAHAALARGGHAVTVIRDSPGLVAQRVVATIVNIACEMAQMRIATPGDIDRATTLGLGYPAGPLALGDRLGPARIVQVLDAIARATGDPRYRASLWLRRRAALGVSLTREDT